MIEKTAHRDGLFVGTFQIGQIGSHTLSEVDLALVIELHDSQQRGSGFRHRSQVIDIAFLYRQHRLPGNARIFISMVAKRFIVNGMAIFHHHHLASWEGAFTDTQHRQRVYSLQLLFINTEIFRRIYHLRILRREVSARSRRIETANGCREPTSDSGLASYGFRHISLYRLSSVMCDDDSISYLQSLWQTG